MAGYYDVLTDLPNRVLLQTVAQQIQAQREGKCVAVIYLDLDGFKQVNDAMGHAVGDQLLVQWSRRQAGRGAADRHGALPPERDEFVCCCQPLAAPSRQVWWRKLMQQCVEPFVLQGVTVAGAQRRHQPVPTAWPESDELAPCRRCDVCRQAGGRADPPVSEAPDAAQPGGAARRTGLKP